MSFFEKLNTWARNSVMLKLLIVGFMILLFMIPKFLITDLIRERSNLRDRATAEVSQKWGGNQTIGGPVISVPYRQEIRNFNADGDYTGSTYNKGYAHFLPDAVDIQGELIPSERYRGIYVVVLYNTLLKVKGNFGTFNTDNLSISDRDILWDKALFTVGISDMKGVQEAIELSFADSTYQLGPGTVTNDIFASGASVPIKIDPKSKKIDFDFEINLNGSTDLYFTPFGKVNTVALNSTWANPSFDGSFLPDNREVSPEGFSANWKVLQLNRNYQQSGTGNYIRQNRVDKVRPYYDEIKSYSIASQDINYRETSNAFGVKLMLPVDEYQKTYRSANYAAIFIIITFLTFFFIEVLNRKRLHPIQYLLVGTAVILFYVLLLSLSEHLTFNIAYFISCAVILALITGYCSFILDNRKLTLLMFGVLTILYLFFYSLLQLQDYALLMGSFGLLAILGTVMYLTRNVDWYGIKKS